MRVVLQHMPRDLLLTITATRSTTATGRRRPGVRGLIAQGMQPSVVGAYEIHPVTGEVRTAELAHDGLTWGGCWWPATPPGRPARQRQLWYAGI